MFAFAISELVWSEHSKIHTVSLSPIYTPTTNLNVFNIFSNKFHYDIMSLGISIINGRGLRKKCN